LGEREVGCFIEAGGDKNLRLDGGQSDEAAAGERASG